MPKIYYKIDESGTKKVTETEQEIQCDDLIFQRFATEKVAKISSVFDCGIVGASGLENPVSVSMKGKLVAFTLKLTELPIQTKFAMKDGFLVPDFAAKTPGSTTFSLKWPVPPAMRLYLLVTMTPDSHISGEQYLVAYDAAGRSYRLPTTNIFETCMVCTGKYDNTASSYLESVIKAYAQFQKSPWQDHLNDRGGVDGMANSMKLFKFKPLEKEGFQAVLPEDHWAAYCQKVNTPLINDSIVL